MPEEGKSKSELSKELNALRQRLAEFERVTRKAKHEGYLPSERQSSHADRHVAELLTKTEMKVLRFILDGKSSKEIAYLLHRSVRTIEVHRSRIMRKLGVDNLVDLVKRAAAMGLLDLQGNTHHRS